MDKEKLTKAKEYRREYYQKNKKRIAKYQRDYYQKKRGAGYKPKMRWKGEKPPPLKITQGTYLISFK